MFTRLFSTILISIVLGAVPQVAFSQCVIDQAYEPNVTQAPFGTVIIGDHPEPFGDALAAQVFTVGISGRLCRIDVIADREAEAPNTGNVILEVQTTTAGVPDGAIVASTSRPRADLPTGLPELISFDLPNPPTVEAGEVLAIVLRTDGEMCSIYFKDNAYAAGRGLFKAETISWTEIADFEPGTDFGFRTYIQLPISVEEKSWSRVRALYR